MKRFVLVNIMDIKLREESPGSKFPCSARTTMAEASSNNGGTDQVLVEETSSSVRTFILNRPNKLNALSYEMLSRLLELFYASEQDSNVKMIILKGNGRAFCAGGDVTAVVPLARQGNWKFGDNYFQEGYILNYVMATYSKPQVSILNGIVMGGGAGVSVPGRFRVATEKSVFAMPETALGFFPDIGASYCLSRLPGFFGEYAGLTGARLDGAEMLACGLATHFVSLERLPLLEQALVKVSTSDPNVITAIISRFSHAPKLKKESPYHKMKIINQCFSRRTIEEIISTLENEALDKKDDWISSTVQLLKKASPISLKISLRSGCRAILEDKDRNPKWEPSRLDLIRDDDVARYFSKIDDEDWEDLKLPPRSNLPPHAIAKL
ncbi:3-hydroxyisobutyryl-CoA hydrolase 1-like isoform X2 [Nicotiana sylvestris]|uniref:3-hydroxyisobutyryl-CoA hydrolase n=2 Tax=Nicotiana TaxID=4085 RepID=A0A1S4BWK2_TOBAC|nr:PREDICTED: 3-hydroxyisobutyryl-CoA hydrolase 1-like isoform X2 [Nicotiana sylvestris]XP_016493281.1 PREDICTED: 3-hydroxyisobutyryl-CoA hydrolase 1-like isoform X2 [Nicotiana tabacum]